MWDFKHTSPDKYTDPTVLELCERQNVLFFFFACNCFFLIVVKGLG